MLDPQMIEEENEIKVSSNQNIDEKSKESCDVQNYMKETIDLTKEAKQDFKYLLLLEYPNDPANTKKFNIKINNEFKEFCCSIRPNQPYINFPINESGRAFRKC